MFQSSIHHCLRGGGEVSHQEGHLQIRCQILVFYAGVTFFLGTSAVAVSATHVALSNFGADFVNAAAVGHHAAYVVLLCIGSR